MAASQTFPFGSPLGHPHNRNQEKIMTNGSKTGFQLPSRSRAIASAILALLLLALVVPVSASRSRVIPAPKLGNWRILQVPAGNKISTHAVGVGVMIYSWTGTRWNFASPEAILYAPNASQEVIGFHLAGPSWESLTGSAVIANTLQSCTPKADAIPWLLLGASAYEGRGIFTQVTYIQRLNTVGGAAPASPGTSPGQVVRIPYPADYYFYKKQ